MILLVLESSFIVRNMIKILCFLKSTVWLRTSRRSFSSLSSCSDVFATLKGARVVKGRKCDGSLNLFGIFSLNFFNSFKWQEYSTYADNENELENFDESLIPDFKTKYNERVFVVQPIFENG